MKTDPQHPNVHDMMAGPLAGLPLPDFLNLPDYELGFWQAAQREELRIQQCSQCGLFRHLPSPMCHSCHSFNYRWTEVSGRGRVYSFVIVHHPVHTALKAGLQIPYNLCLIELREQANLRLLSNVLDIDNEDIKINMDVRVCFKRVPATPDLILPFFIRDEV